MDLYETLLSNAKNSAMAFESVRRKMLLDMIMSDDRLREVLKRAYAKYEIAADVADDYSYKLGRQMAAVLVKRNPSLDSGDLLWDDLALVLREMHSHYSTDYLFKKQSARR